MKIYNLNKILATAALMLLCQNGWCEEPEPTPFNYDLNDDKKFDEKDIELLATKILETEEWDADLIPTYDASGDGKVDVADILVMLKAIQNDEPGIGIGDEDSEIPDEANAPVRRDEE